MESLAELHPFFVHFPVAFFVLYFLFEILSIYNTKFEQPVLIILACGVVTGVLSVLTGNQAANIAAEIYKSKEIVYETVENHEYYATLLLWYYFVILVLRYFLQLKKKLSKRNKIIFIIFSIIGLFILFQTGKIGNELVYKFGVGTIPGVEFQR